MITINNDNDIDRNSEQMHSDEMQDLIDNSTSFTERWGILLFSFLFMILILISYYLRYPNFVITPGTLTSDYSPKNVVPLYSGHLNQLNVIDGEYVKSGDTIAIIESIADLKDVILLSNDLSRYEELIQNNHSFDINEILKFGNSNFGELQEDYSTFVSSMQSLAAYSTNGVSTIELAQLKNELILLKRLNDELVRKKDFASKDIDSSVKSLNINRRLLEEKVISPDEYRVNYSKVMAKKMMLPQVDAELISNRSTIQMKLSQIDKLISGANDQRNASKQSLRNLKSKIDDWCRNFIILSPADGYINFTQVLQDNSMVEKSQTIAFVNSTVIKPFAEVTLPQSNLGEVAIGMKVQMRLDSYPYTKYGFLTGKVNYISIVSSKNGYRATIALDNGLTTSNKYNISYKDGLTLSAYIITKDMSVLERLYYSAIQWR